MNTAFSANVNVIASCEIRGHVSEWSMSALVSADICLLPWQLAHQGTEMFNGPHSGVSRLRQQLSTRARYITDVTPEPGPGVSCGVPAKLLSQASDCAAV